MMGILRLEPLGTVNRNYTSEVCNVWTEYFSDVIIPDDIHSIYITYTGNGGANFASFTLK